MATLLSTVHGNRPQEQTEYLSLSCNGKIRYLTAYNKGNGYIKLFTLQNYINFYYLNKAYNSVDISLDLYNDNKALENLIKEKFYFQTI